MNKKIKNANPLEYNGIQFKSKLEVTIYKTFKELGFDIQYEPEKITIWEGFKPTIPFYTKDKKTGLLKLDNKKLISITYTPDFIFKYKDLYVIVEGKGIFNDVYPYKRKLFRQYLEKVPNSVYFEIYSKKQALQAAEIIKRYDIDREN